jgi:hypothetical protein
MPRKEKKYNFIYKTTNLLSGRYYIGMHSTDNLDDGYLGSGNRLILAVRKHGRENFKREILEFCDNRECLKRRESEIVNLDEVSKKECMNLAVGGEGGNTDSGGPQAFAKRLREDKEFREIHAKRSSETMKKTHSQGKIKYDTFTGKRHSEASKKLMSESSKEKGVGASNSQFGTCWITKDGVNKKIKMDELKTFTQNGWVKGRKV